MADKEILAAEADAAAVEQDLIHRVSSAYFTVLLRESDRDVANKRLELFSATLQKARLALEAGTGDIISVREARAAMDRASSQLINVETGLAIAREELMILVRRDFSSLSDLQHLTPRGPEPDRVDDWIQAALINQPLLAQARNRHESSMRTRGL